MGTTCQYTCHGVQCVNTRCNINGCDCGYCSTEYPGRVPDYDTGRCVVDCAALKTQFEDSAGPNCCDDAQADIAVCAGLGDLYRQACDCAGV